MIPPLHDSVLPEGIHECTMNEVEHVFGRFQRSDRRIRLTEKLKEFAEEARRSRIVVALLIDGSYVTAKEEPNDVDLIVAYRTDFDLAQELRPFEYNCVSMRAIKRRFPFDVFVEVEGSEPYLKWVELFTRVRKDDEAVTTPQTRKGLLRVAL